MRSRIRAWGSRVIPVLIAAGALALVVPTSAAALCATDPATARPFPNDPQGVVFVGTAIETRTNGYSALFHVEEVWLGGPLPEWQPVLGSDHETEGMWIEDAVQWKVGTQYLVTTQRRGTMLLGGSACSGNARGRVRDTTNQDLVPDQDRIDPEEDTRTRMRNQAQVELTGAV
ncbi:MAG: hypothetical protein M3O93_04690, partial [Chloroflexota bacterium]|nr:hypothetical protein [Chloroflexota bacterium]